MPKMFYTPPQSPRRTLQFGTLRKEGGNQKGSGAPCPVPREELLRHLEVLAGAAEGRPHHGTPGAVVFRLELDRDPPEHLRGGRTPQPPLPSVPIPPVV